MRKPLGPEKARQLAALSHKVRYAKREQIIDKLKAFGGFQGNYRLWSTEHLKILLEAWTKK